MRAGLLNKQIKLQRMATTIDDYGVEALSVAEEKTVWASVNHKPSEELLANTAEELIKACVFKMRKRPIDEGWIIFYLGDSYNIKSIYPMGEDGLEVLATAGGRDAS